MTTISHLNNFKVANDHRVCKLLDMIIFKTSLLDSFIFEDQKVAKMKRKSQNKSTNTNRFQDVSPDYEEEEELSAKRKGRQDNSLSVLTKKFIQLIKKSQNYTIDLNLAVQQLGVQKRRIYDITNVLEGINYVEKTQKNMIRWIGQQNEMQQQRQSLEIKEMIYDLAIQEESIDREIAQLNKKLKEEYLQHEEYRKYKYITFDDCLNIYKSMCKQQTDKGLLVLSAPKGSKMQVRQEEDGECTLMMDTDGRGYIKAFSCDLNGGVKQLEVEKK